MFYYQITVSSEEMFLLLDALISHRFAFVEEKEQINELKKHLQEAQPLTLDQLELSDKLNKHGQKSNT